MKQQTIVISLIMFTTFIYNMFIGYQILPMILLLGVVFCLYVILKSLYDAVNINECTKENQEYMKRIEIAMKAKFE